jgi:glyoxylase-like metal-dependent hydrolase (beta-lactamase superfamily II)
MEDYVIYPLRTGEFRMAEKSNFTYQVDFGTKIVAPIIAYLIKGRDKAILVDSGGSDEAWAQQYHHPINRTPEMEIQNQLKKFGVEVKDIEILINTHLHWDHSFNNALFSKARIYTQKKEIRYAVDPLAPHWVYYESWQLGMTPRWFKAYSQMITIDGDYNLFPGIDIVTLPGHTPGFQGVLVNTAKGRCLIASDCQALFENWSGNALHKHIISGIHHDMDDYYRTFAKMEKICDYILPGHDPEVFAKASYPE